MNRSSNKHAIITFILSATLVIAGILAFATLAFAQETGGELGGGAGIFRPKNPTAKRSGAPPKPVRPRMNPAELEASFQDALAEGNDARDERKFGPAEAAYRRALTVKPHDARAEYAIGNVFVDQQRWDDAETSYRAAYATAPNEDRKSVV